MMEPVITLAEEKLFIGKRLAMSLTDNKTAELWKSFMQLRREITNFLSSDLYSINVYSADYFEAFNPEKTFEKWAAVEVPNVNYVPAGLEGFTIPKGLYAVFHYKGSSSDTSIYQYIFGSWLPQSSFVLDHRPHFEVLGEKYKNNDPSSEEDIWIPVKPKI